VVTHGRMKKAERELRQEAIRIRSEAFDGSQ
jgi:hypothetical protein